MKERERESEKKEETEGSWEAPGFAKAKFMYICN